MLTRAMALDHAHENIRVNCICPSLVETEIATQLFANAPNPEEARRQRVGMIPMGRAATPVGNRSSRRLFGVRRIRMGDRRRISN